jgi:hypothetical protein
MVEFFSERNIIIQLNIFRFLETNDLVVTKINTLSYFRGTKRLISAFKNEFKILNKPEWLVGHYQPGVLGFKKNDVCFKFFNLWKSYQI